jgi:hypothetical protein
MSGAVDEASPRRARAAAILQLAFGALLFLALDASLFGEQGYLPWVSPDSGLGRLFYIMRFVSRDPAANGGVIVFGNSRVAEGFSEQLATDEARRLGSSTTFLSSAVPGTSPRVWYYTLRRYRERGLRPAAVAYMVVDYEDGAGGYSPDNDGDIAYLHPYLGWRDAIAFPLSFQAPELRWEALAAVPFKAWPYHADALDFLSNPRGRVKAVEFWREHGKSTLDAYRGHEESLAGLTLDAATGALTGARGLEPSGRLRKYADQLLQTRAATPPDAAAAEYERFWFSAAAQLCREMGAKFIVFREPHGPLHYLAPPRQDAHGVLAELAEAGELRLMRADAFDDLEHPEFFFDELHMNRAGGEIFSPRFARETLYLLSH